MCKLSAGDGPYQLMLSQFPALPMAFQLTFAVADHVTMTRVEQGLTAIDALLARYLGLPQRGKIVRQLPLAASSPARRCGPPRMKRSCSKGASAR